MGSEGSEELSSAQTAKHLSKALLRPLHRSQEATCGDDSFRRDE